MKKKDKVESWERNSIVPEKPVNYAYTEKDAKLDAKESNGHIQYRLYNDAQSLSVTKLIENPDSDIYRNCIGGSGLDVAEALTNVELIRIFSYAKTIFTFKEEGLTFKEFSQQFFDARDDIARILGYPDFITLNSRPKS